MQKVLLTGVSGFIGYHLARRLAEKEGMEVWGIDAVNDYYDPTLKIARLRQLGLPVPEWDDLSWNKVYHSNTLPIHFQRTALEDAEAIEDLFRAHDFDYVINLAAQAGVRYSLTHPRAYTRSNIDGFLNILEGARIKKPRHLIYASSSSVYGLNRNMPFRVGDNVDHPISLYAATKKANELMAHTYAYLYDIPTTGLRFFTVYGPWGRPDMALFIFTQKILAGEPIEVYNYGKMQRDFTYIDDIVEGIVRLMPVIPTSDDRFDPKHPDPSTSSAPYRLYNIGNHTPVALNYFIEQIEKALGKKAEKKLLPMQPGDVPATYADVSALSDATGFAPHTPIEEGIRRFIEWYRWYYRV